MRILIANDGFGDAGGVQSYLDRVARGLAARGHGVAILHRDAQPGAFAAAAAYRFPQFTVAHAGIETTLDAVRHWRPDVCFSHNMDRLDVDRQLADRWPVVKFMHGYLGTCIGGQKQHRFPMAQPCERAFGPACLALYGPRHCGQLSLGTFVDQYRWAIEQRRLFARYRSIVVASAHMKREYVRNGVDPGHIDVNPLFPTHDQAPRPADAGLDRRSVVFLGRMTVLKGADVLIRAIADASSRLGSPIELVVIGDGPQRAACERLAARLGVDATFCGWLKGDERWDWVRGATLLALPSTWPEPFGLVGLEAAALGVPAIAFDVGGVREWLRSGETGFLVPADPPRASRFADILVDAFRRPEALAAMRARALATAREMSLDRHLDRLEQLLAADRQSYAHFTGR
jgi:glycosyltransferase involved in cell wall biosynthesis